MAYILTNENNDVVTFPYYDHMLRRDNPNTSFPKKMTDATRATFNMYPVIEGDRPEYDGEVHDLTHDTPTYANNVWSHTWTKTNKPQSVAEANVRATRDKLLEKTDWWAVSDRTMTTEQSTYRQNLRDITSQEGFPYSVTWPTKP